MPLHNPLMLEITVITTGFVMLLAEAFVSRADKRSLALTGIFGLTLAFVWSFFVNPAAIELSGAAYSNFYQADAIAIFFKQFILLATILTLILSMEYAPVVVRGVPGEYPGAGLGEFFTLPLFSCAGLMWMVSANDFIMIFVSLELATIALYVLVSYMRRNDQSLEAGTKYLILGALSTGFLVYGITWIFGIMQVTNLNQIRELLPVLSVDGHIPLLFGLGLVLVGLGFKISAVPFQFWVPDVYQGAPTPITAYLSVASKAAGFVVLMRVIDPFLLSPVLGAKLLLLLSVLAGATLLYGNLAAMLQTNVKRLLAYSAIAHAGYLLVGIASVGAPGAGDAVAFYLAGYLLMTFLAFYVLVLVAKATDGGEEMDSFNGLNRRSPFLAFAMLMAMVSLAGLPFTVGFIGKFLIFVAAIDQQHWVLVALGAISVACGFYYYLRVARAMYWQAPPENADPIVLPLYIRITLIVLMALIVVLGIFPQPVLSRLAPLGTPVTLNHPNH